MKPLNEEPRLRVFENWVLGRIFESTGDYVTGVWRNIHNEELQKANNLVCITPSSEPFRTVFYKIEFNSVITLSIVGFFVVPTCSLVGG